MIMISRVSPWSKTLIRFETEILKNVATPAAATTTCIGSMKNYHHTKFHFKDKDENELYSSLHDYTKLRRSNLIPQNYNLLFKRNSTFFTKLTAEQLWKGVTSVSNIGRKRGRGRSKKTGAKDLNRGQIIGVGRDPMLWPGLNSPVVRGKELVRQQKMPPDPNYSSNLLEMRDRMGVFRQFKLSPLDRGWSGNKWPGRSIGPPDPIGEETFEGFDTRVLESKIVHHMDSVQGRRKKFSFFVVTGNKNGLAGFALAKASTGRSAMSRSKNKAAQNLLFFDRCEGHTVFHDFHCKFLRSSIYVKMKPEGYGLVCHRAIKEICQLIGIKNLYAKLEGSRNIQNVTKAFFLGLLNQQNHQKLANEKGLVVAKIREGTYPKISAKPSSGSIRSKKDINMDEEIDFKLYTMGGKVEVERKKFVPFYTRLPCYERHLKKLEKCRNHEKIRKQLSVDHGEVISFLTATYPECRPRYKMPEEAEEEGA